jgi:hypothetical protein
MRWTIAIIAVLVAVAAPTALADGKVTVSIVGANNGHDVTNGGVSGRGHWTMKGAFADSGKVVAYRTVVGNLATGNATITLRFAATGRKGRVTFVVTTVVKPTRTGSTWKITSGTKVYKGLYGHGVETENDNHTVVTLSGTAEHPRLPN